MNNLHSGNRFTIFTPTYNRARTLGRLYESLIKQTVKDFAWLIVDDGSTDETSKLIGNWKTQNIIPIEYHYKENGGKHTSMLLGHKLVKTRYIIGIDSDDTLDEKAVESFDSAWREIEDAGMEISLAEVRAFTSYSNGSLVGHGNYTMPSGRKYIDCTWHEMTLKNRNYREMIACWNTEKLNECVDISKYTWYSDKVKYIGENIFWSAIGRKYKTRFLNYVGRYYFTDTDNSLSREVRSQESRFVNEMVNHKYFLDENFSYFFWNPGFYINLIIKFIISGLASGKPVKELYGSINNRMFRFTYLAGLPLGFSLYAYYRFIRKRYWF